MHSAGGALTRTPTPQVYVYYHLHRFYQNHKRYVRSRSDAQLAGKTRDPSIKCQPEQYEGDGQSRPINPCGLIAWSLFNDSFAATVAGPSGPGRTLLLDVRAQPNKWGADRGFPRPT